jgi:polyhydroxyalkanoate synthesis regulator phasin
MVELIKKTLLAGVGLAALSKEKAEELAREIANATQTSGEKGKEFVDEVVARSNKARKDLEDTIQRYVTEQLKRLNLPTKDDITALNARIEELERSLAAKAQ